MLKDALSDSLVYGVASVITKGMTVFLLPLYTRVLSVSDFGAFDLLVTLGALANLVVALEISQGLARFWPETNDPIERYRLSSTTLWFTIFMYATALVIGLLLSPYLNFLILGDVIYLEAFQISLVFIAVNGIYHLLLNQFRWELRSKAYSIVGFSYALLTLFFASIFCLWQGMGLVGVVLSQLLAALCSVALSLWLLRSTFGFVFDQGKLKAMLKFSAPLVPAGFAVFLSIYMNRFALSHFSSLDDVGLFAMASRIASLSALIIIGIQAALTPLVYQHYKEPDTPQQLAKLFGYFLALAFLGSLFLAIFARELIAVFATSDFLEAAVLVACLAPALLLSQMYIFAPGIAIYKKTHWQLGVTLLSAAISMSANWLLVPLWGGLGAAVATLLSALIFFLAWLVLSQRLYPIPYDWPACLLGLLVFIIGTSVGVQFDRLDPGLPLSLIFKSLLLFCAFGAIVYCRLLPIADIRKLFSYISARFSRSCI